MAAGEIREPFAVINADDFYGAESYRLISGFLSKKQSGNIEEYCLVDYKLNNTLSESGTVSRGVCKVDREGFLTGIAEHKKIGRTGDQITGELEGKGEVIFTGNEPVSMNLIGFRPSMFEHLKTQFAEFLQQDTLKNDSEFYIPYAMNEVIRLGMARVKALHTSEKWFGVTYREDREMVMNNLRSLVAKGIYPTDLWA